MTTQNTDLILASLAVLQLATLLLVLLQYKPNVSGKKSGNKRIVLDTSAVIDGRVLALAEAGFLNNTELISTNIILDELQYLADEGDSFKRSRARHGLDVLNKLSGLNGVSVVTKNLLKSDLEVDQQLLNLAKSLNAQLFTADFNLAQRAKVEGVNILSPNELAESLKPQILPGENFTLKLIQKGDDRGQAVGYLPDGTMVVAENAQNKIGQTVELKSSKIIQTAGGRIVFAQQASNQNNNSKSQNQNQSSKPNNQSKPKRPVKQNPKPNENKKRYQPKTKEDSLIETINNSN